MEYTPYLVHYGVKGMKWGVRRYQNKDGTLTAAGKKRNASSSKSSDADKEKRRSTAKKVAATTAAVVTVAAAATIYAKNKDAIDGFVSKYADKAVKGIDLVKNEAEYQKTMAQVVKYRKNETYARTHKSEILASPSKLNRYKQFYTEDTINKAIKKIQQEQNISELSRKRIRNGADYAQSILAYGTVATSAYALANSQPVKGAKKKRKS